MYEYSAENGRSGYAGESPLHEILSAEAPLATEMYESPLHETYHEEEWAGESPYHEVAQEAAIFEAPYGEMHEAPGELYGETLGEYAVLGEYAGETGGFPQQEWQEILSEDEELALAAELLEIQTEEELDQFLGKLVRRISRGVRGFIRSPIGRMLGGVLRKVAKVALPIAGKALGTFVGGPAGALIGGKLAGVASQAMGLELYEMSGQEADFAAARQFVRFASDMMRRAQTAPPRANPAAVVRQAVQSAAQQHAPGLLSRSLPRLRVGPARGGRRGVWVRRGPTITLFGV